MLSRRVIWQVLRLAFSLALVAFVATKVDLTQLAGLLTGANLPLVGLAFLVSIATWAVGSIKWQLLLRGLGTDAPIRVLIWLNLAGVFYGLFLPGQLGGEVVKGIKLARYGVGAAATTVTIGVDRLTGLTAIGILAVVGLAFTPSTVAGPSLRLAAFAVLVASLSPLLLLPASPVVERGFRWAGRWMTWGPARAALGMVQTLAAAFLQYRRSPGTLVRALAWSVVVQGMIVASNYIAAWSLGIDVPLLGLTWIVALTSVLYLIPFTFAGLGVREGAYVVLLQSYGVAPAQGLGLALLVFALMVAQGVLGGLLDLAQGMGLSRRTALADDATAALPHPPVRRS